MTTTQHHAPSRHRPAQVLRRIGRTMTTRSTAMDRAQDARSKMDHASQVQFVRAFRM